MGVLEFNQPKKASNFSYPRTWKAFRRDRHHLNHTRRQSHPNNRRRVSDFGRGIIRSLGGRFLRESSPSDRSKQKADNDDNGDDEFGMSKPMLSAYTGELIKIKVEELLRDQNGICTLYDVISAIRSNPHVIKSHVDEDETSWVPGKDDEKKDGAAVRKLTHLLDIHHPFYEGKYSAANLIVGKVNNIKYRRKYQLMIAFDMLKSKYTVGVRGIAITKWEAAKDHLKSVLDFQSSNLEQNVEDDAADASNASRSNQNAAELTVQQQPSALFQQQGGAHQLESDDIDQYRKRLQAVQLKEFGLKPGERELLQIARTPATRVGHDFAVAQLRLEAEYELTRRKKQVIEEIEERLRQKEEEEEARKKLSELVRPFTEEEQKLIARYLRSIGPDGEVLFQNGTDSVQRGSIQRLRPGQWLNDEVIHYFLGMLANRDEELCRQNPGRKRSHFFKSFFFTTLLNEGHASKDGMYEYKNVKRWSKKVPGKDIFNLDKIVIPINVGRMHWVCIVAFMQKKRIQFYDSMGDSGKNYVQHLFQYIMDEHVDKRKKPLPDADDWELVTCTPDTPQQENGFDCGVFTCMFADFLSKDCPLSFDQSHVTQCRERIALSIINGKAIM